MTLIYLALSFCAWLALRLLLWRKHGIHVKTMAVLGSGGHTAELFRVMGDLDRFKFTPRVYVVAKTDKLGAIKAQQHEQRWACSDTAVTKSGGAAVHYIPRSREVGQSWVTSALSTLWATLFAVSIVVKERPGLLMVNGPGTCLPLCMIAHVARCLGVLNTKIVFVESIARTRLLSLTGKIIYHCRMSDLFLVQWPGLRQQFPRSQCLGRVY